MVCYHRLVDFGRKGICSSSRKCPFYVLPGWTDLNEYSNSMATECVIGKGPSGPFPQCLL